ncbi:hypothetical protein FA13DRAFT_1766197 [Coprinellus micaceus]|uniref:Uncharacterized protein n=1 Tax=Coprinellus micaceus TaxID=71717 RepID=A0A4Y7SPD1_COPMI|nr:hypothetical protein FA13DRAFT_1766197 [Coprinellus micaceus]
MSTLVPVAVPDANENPVVAGVKRPRPGQFDEDSGEPVPVRRLTVDSEGPRRDAFQSRDESRPPSGRAPVPPIASVPADGRSNEAELAMEVGRPQQPALQSPAPAPCPQQPPVPASCPQQPHVQSPPPAPPTPASLLAAASTAAVPDTAPNVAKGEPATEEEKGDGNMDEEVVVKFEDEVDQLMEELVNFDDGPEEGEVMEIDEERAIRSSPAPQPSNNAASEPSAPTSRLPSLPPDHDPAAPLPPPGQPGQQQQPGAPYVPPARSWARAYPNRPPQKSWSQSSPSADTFPSCLSKPVKEDPSAPKLSVMKHWVLLYIDDGTEWKCRLCQTMPNAGRPRAVFHKKASCHEAMLQHSQTEHPVACADMAKLSNDKLAEMKARLPPQGRQ